MGFVLALVLCGLLITVTGYYRGRIAAMESNPVTRVRIIPRTMYDDMMGVSWESAA